MRQCAASGNAGLLFHTRDRQDRIYDGRKNNILSRFVQDIEPIHSSSCSIDKEQIGRFQIPDTYLDPLFSGHPTTGRKLTGKSARELSAFSSSPIRAISAATSFSVCMPPQLLQLVCSLRTGISQVKIGLTTRGLREVRFFRRSVQQ